MRAQTSYIIYVFILFLTSSHPIRHGSPQALRMPNVRVTDGDGVDELQQHGDGSDDGSGGGVVPGDAFAALAAAAATAAHADSQRIAAMQTQPHWDAGASTHANVTSLLRSLDATPVHAARTLRSGGGGGGGGIGAGIGGNGGSGRGNNAVVTSGSSRGGGFRGGRRGSKLRPYTASGVSSSTSSSSSSTSTTTTISAAASLVATQPASWLSASRRADTDANADANANADADADVNVDVDADANDDGNADGGSGADSNACGMNGGVVAAYIGGVAADVSHVVGQRINPLNGNGTASAVSRGDAGGGGRVQRASTAPAAPLADRASSGGGGGGGGDGGGEGERHLQQHSRVEYGQRRDTFYLTPTQVGSITLSFLMFSSFSSLFTYIPYLAR
jgi:hypothetical protein